MWRRSEFSRRRSAVTTPLSILFFMFLTTQVRWTLGKTGYDYGNGNGFGGIPGYQAQGGGSGRLTIYPDERGAAAPSCGGLPGAANRNCVSSGQGPPSRVFMQPRKFPRTGNCAYLSKCTTCQDACPPPPGGCNKPTQIPTPPGENPTDCCPQWKCGNGGGNGWPPKNGGCRMNGKAFANGEVFKDGCIRKCICQNGHFACNPMCESSVPPINCRNPRQRKIEGECCPTWECDTVLCNFNGKEHKVGAKVDNGCDGQCICTESGMMYCVPYCPQTRVMPSAMCPNPKLISGRNGTSVISPATCCDRWECDFRRIDRSCMYKGKRYQDGESFEDNCDWNCKCYAGKISCSSKCVVSLVPPQNTCTETEHFKEENHCCHHWQCCHKVNFCYDNGRQYTQGETFFKGCDSRCVCTYNGQIHCISRCPTLIDLPPSADCPYPRKIKDNKDGCCDVWICEERTPCVWKDKHHEDGEVWYDNPCDICNCRAGKVHCNTRCPQTLVPPGSPGCKPVQVGHDQNCPSCLVWECEHIPKICKYGDVQYTEGDRWNVPCDLRCLCIDGRVECIAMCPETHVRPSHSCPNPVKVTKEGQCCPIWECPCDSVCKVNDREYQDGDIWTEGCAKKCRCVAGIIDCVSVCPPIQVINSLQCLNPIKHDQGCCPIYECPPPTGPPTWPPGNPDPNPPRPDPCPPCANAPCPCPEYQTGGGVTGVGGVTGGGNGPFGITVDLRPCVLGTTNCLPGGSDGNRKPCVLGTVGCRPAGCPPCPNGQQTPKCTYPLQVQRPGMCCPMWKCVQYY